MSVRVFAPAKLNLTLEIGPRAADGFHPLRSIVTFMEDVGDWIEAAHAPALRLDIDGTFAAALEDDGSDNLVLRAAQALGARGAAIKLTKNLPVASGLGGGSGDAGAALRALNMLWNLGLSDVALEAHALRLGSDGPACFRARPLLVEGRGERLTPVALGPYEVVLVNPLAAISTAAAYAHFDAAGPVQPLNAARDVAEMLADPRNDLTHAAIALAPEVGLALGALKALRGALSARVSGSGASCFAIMQSESARLEAVAQLRRDHPRWWVVGGRTRASL